jgi:putative peptide zinc metalloprotease protein
MNLSEVLNVALPELPVRRIKGYPRLHPKLVMREHLEDGLPTMVGVVSGGTYVYRFNLDQWSLVQLFDGQRSYKEVAELFEQQRGMAIDEAQVQELAGSLEELEFWYQTPLEKNVTATQKLADQRQKRVKKKTIDMGQLVIASWDPDLHISKLYNSVKFVYSRWFICGVLGMFAIMAAIFISGWSEIWNDTVQYYTFTDKGAADLAEFWLLFCGLGFFHESAHAVTCKHFGGEVHNMGFMLIYFSPAFFADISEVYVYGSKWPRVAAIIAGIWVELMFCAAATVVWWGTPAGSPIHDFTYKVMLITGVAVVLMNLNPLIKLDGYYLLGELVGIPTIKENSTEYLGCWVKRNLFHLPVDVPYHSTHRRLFFSVYAILSGLYSYTLLLTIVRFSYNVFSRFSPEWAFVPSCLLAFVIFKSRLRTFARFMKDLYLDKTEMIRRWFGGRRGFAVAALVLVAVFVPLWPENVEGRFLLEAQRRAVVRAPVDGQVTQIMTGEGTMIAAGASILRLENLHLRQESNKAQADLRTAEVDVRKAQSSYAGLGAARAEQATDFERGRSLAAQTAALDISSPIAGIVVTPSLRNLAGSFVSEGSELAEVDDTRSLQARIFVPEFEIHKVFSGASCSLKLVSLFRPVRGKVSSISPASSDIAPGLISQEKYKGSAPPRYYIATVWVDNPGELRPGMSGNAKIRVARQSLAGFLWNTVREFAQRKLW